MYIVYQRRFWDLEALNDKRNDDSTLDSFDDKLARRHIDFFQQCPRLDVITLT